MALNWNAESVKDWDNLPEYKFNVIEWTMAIGIGQIKKNNVDEWCDRARFMRDVHGPMSSVRSKDENREDYHPMEDREFITKMIGLRTNVSNIPQNKWLKQLFGGKVSDWAWERLEEKREAEDNE
tara:strand:+ start:319 stop:693 length:375 start_codon:yes stop_codon:yes gene_type:complete